MSDEELEFKIGDAIKREQIPDYERNGTGKYKAVWEKVRALPAGEWLPVTVLTPRIAFRLTQNAKNKNFWAKRRRLTVYISRKT